MIRFGTTPRASNRCADYATFKEAERVAKRARSTREVYALSPNGRRGVLLATIKPDASGKMWTDLTMEGCKYA